MMIDVSVIVPTRNRAHLVGRLVRSLLDQELRTLQMEVIIVDDGSTDGTGDMVFPDADVSVSVSSQDHLGPVAARNHGVELAQGEIVVIVDDDIILSPGSISSFCRQVSHEARCISIGRLRMTATGTGFDVALHQIPSQHLLQGATFADLGGFFACARTDYLSLGGMHEIPFPGHEFMWCDVELGYRAWQAGFQFGWNTATPSIHDDPQLGDFDRYRHRLRLFSTAAVLLSQKHPGILGHLPMFTDKTPIRFGNDPLWHIVRKMIRSVLSTGVSRHTLGLAAKILRVQHRPGFLARKLELLVIGAEIWLGLREGIQSFGSLGVI